MHRNNKISIKMEQLDNILLKLCAKEIHSGDLQEVMLHVKKTSNCNEPLEECYMDILSKLWIHLNSELLEFDDQLLCSTCFYSVLSYCREQELYLNKALQIINHEIVLKGTPFKSDEKNNSSLVISLCYGMFQSSYLMQNTDKPLQLVVSLLKTIFQLLMIMANEYSQYTFIVFKIMSSFKKVIGTPFQELLLDQDNRIKLLNLINQNWENPITGVRSLNRNVLQLLLLILSNDMYEKVFNEINRFYWNKAKFLMLTEFIENSNSNIEELVSKNQWVHGLLYSLNNPGLVSAGADMYYAILNKIISENGWAKLYLSDVVKILNGLSFKAIENFSNYWCLSTFKKFPTLVQVLINELQEQDESEFKLHSCLCIIKQANKLGLVEKTWLLSKYNKEENLVLSGLEHCSVSVRMMAFEIICISQRKCLPPNIEFLQILKFLRSNVNSDCTVLRLSILNNLAKFFNTLHTTFLNSYKNNSHDLCDLTFFCENLQMFVIESINVNGNYQRKITTVKLANLILKHFNEVPKKKHKQIRDTSVSLITYLKENGHWLLNSRDYIMKLVSLLKDPATDVHDCVLQILLDFYLPDISDTMIIDHLIEESLICIKSNFFFEISCGLNTLKLITNILIKKENAATKFGNIEDIFYFAFNEITTEYNAKIDIMESISRGKQMHSFLSILYIVFNVIIRNSYEMAISVETMITLMNILKDISNQFAWEEHTTTSSDFSEMNDMVLSLIKRSSFDENAYDHTNMSGLYQSVLNCYWLNVKATCELATILIQYNNENLGVCEECLNIMVHVLETSRHKGAIEAAGVALGEGIRYLTSPGVNLEVSKLPLFLLKRKLNELLLETSKMSSVTRRGAGLSIMIHRIVSNDAKKGKPLFHYFLKTILNACKSVQTNDWHQEGNDIKDLPKAIYIHFLTKIVTDSSLASDIMYYSAELAELAFVNLINPHWQIRNAALQLYGALIPKLIGQKKPSGIDNEIISSVACDEFRVHSKKLWECIIKQIKDNNHQDTIQAHSNLVPILNTLANIARRYSLSYNLNKEIDSDLDLLPNMFALLASPIHTVRRLTSKCIINIYSLEIILNIINTVTITSENHLHGIIMVIENCYNVYSDVTLYKNQLDSLRNKYCEVLMKGNHSYLCQWNLEKISTVVPEINIDVIKKILEKEKTEYYKPGFFLWFNQKIQSYLQNTSWYTIPETLLLLLNSHDFENHCNIIAMRIKNSKIVPEKVLLDVSKILLSSDLKIKSSMLWKTLYYISQRIHLNMEISTSFFEEHLSHDVTYNMRYMIPFTVRVFAEQTGKVNLSVLSKKIFVLCNPEHNDIDMRYIAAMANNELAYKFRSFPDDIKVNAIKSAVVLLQDENEDIRNLSVVFYSTVNQMDAKHPFVCLNEILNKNFLYAKLNDPTPNIQNICRDLRDFIICVSASKGDELNPFANGCKNSYLEVQVLQQLLINLID